MSRRRTAWRFLALLLVLGVGFARAAEDAGEPLPAPPSEVPLRFDPNELVRVTVGGGASWSGSLIEIDGERLVLATKDGPRVIPVPLIDELRVDGRPTTHDALRRGYRAYQLAKFGRVRVSPPPWSAGLASGLWAGGGPALLGDWRTCLGYTAVELGLIGAAALFVHERQYGNLVPTLLIDGLLRAHAVSASTSEARRRRRIKELAEEMPGPSPAEAAELADP